MENLFPEIAKDVLNNMAGQLIALILIIAAAYIIPYLILSVIRVPSVFKNLISTVVMLFVSYHTFGIIFLV